MNYRRQTASRWRKRGEPSSLDASASLNRFSSGGRRRRGRIDLDGDAFSAISALFQFIFPHLHARGTVGLCIGVEEMKRESSHCERDETKEARGHRRRRRRRRSTRQGEAFVFFFCLRHLLSSSHTRKTKAPPTWRRWPSSTRCLLAARVASMVSFRWCDGERGRGREVTKEKARKEARKTAVKEEGSEKRSGGKRKRCKENDASHFSLLLRIGAHGRTLRLLARFASLFHEEEKESARAGASCTCEWHH